MGKKASRKSQSCLPYDKWQKIDQAYLVSFRGQNIRVIMLENIYGAGVQGLGREPTQAISQCHVCISYMAVGFVFYRPPSKIFKTFVSL